MQCGRLARIAPRRAQGSFVGRLYYHNGRNISTVPHRAADHAPRESNAVKHTLVFEFRQERG
jgi:hypothetical protein